MKKNSSSEHIKSLIIRSIKIQSRGGLQQGKQLTESTTVQSNTIQVSKPKLIDTLRIKQNNFCQKQFEDIIFRNFKKNKIENDSFVELNGMQLMFMNTLKELLSPEFDSKSPHIYLSNNNFTRPFFFKFPGKSQIIHEQKQLKSQALLQIKVEGVQFKLIKQKSEKQIFRSNKLRQPYQSLYFKK